jgi:hypothetical protein
MNAVQQYGDFLVNRIRRDCLRGFSTKMAYFKEDEKNASKKNYRDSHEMSSTQVILPVRLL